MLGLIREEENRDLVIPTLAERHSRRTMDRSME
jgi:hypothetical protein